MWAESSAGQRLAMSWLGFVTLLALVSVGFAVDAASEIDRACLGGCPPSRTHWLGTDSLGRDVAAQLLFGARNALNGGLAAALLSLIVGLGLGSSTAWYGRGGQRVTWWVLAQAAVLCAFVYHWWLYLPAATALALTGASTTVIIIVSWAMKRLMSTSRSASWLSWGVAADRLLLFVAEVTSSVPALLLLLALAALALRPGLLQLVLIYVAVRWTNFAVLALQETRSVLDRPYVEVAHHGGLSRRELFVRHVLPNVLPPVLVLALLSVSGFIIVEGTFAFLGLGLPVEHASWGRVLAEAQQVRGGWWLWVFPGVTLVGTVLSLQVLARRYR